MRRILILCCLLAGLFGGTLVTAQSQFQVAPPQHFVTDLAGFLTETTRYTIDQRLALYQKETGHQVLVWIGNSTNGIPLEDWTVQAFKAWRVGRANLDDGLVLFIFAGDHKVRIEVGYGLEGQIPDVMASQIIKEIIIPGVQHNNHDEAIIAGVDRILELASGDNATSNAKITKSKPTPISRGSRVAIGILGLLAILVLIIRYPNLAIWIIYSMISESRGGRSDGNGSGGGGYSGGGGCSGGGGSSGSW